MVLFLTDTDPVKGEDYPDPPFILFAKRKKILQNFRKNHPVAPYPEIHDTILEKLLPATSNSKIPVTSDLNLVVPSPDPYVFRPPGSGSESFHKQAKILVKTLISAV